MPTVTHDIVAKLWNLCNVRKDDGVTYHQYVTELSSLLFFKMAKETGTEDQLPEAYRWNDLESKTAPNGWSSTSCCRSILAATARRWSKKSLPMPSGQAQRVSEATLSILVA